MSTLMTERRRPLENDDGQGSLFGGEALPPARQARPWQRPVREVRPAAPPVARLGPDADVPAAAAFETAADVIASEARTDPPAGATASAAEARAATVAEPGLVGPMADELVAFETANGADEDAPGTSRAALAGPTLDDVMSRAWEGLVMGLPTACPLCHGEVAPALHGPLYGRCRSCGTTID